MAGFTTVKKDCDRLNRVLADVGAVATNPAGAGKWRAEYNETFRGGRCHRR